MNYLDYKKEDNRVLGRILQTQAETIGDDVFIRQDDVSYTYAETWGLACRYATGLKAFGVGREDNVNIFMESCPEYIFAAFACNLLGARWIPVNTDYRGKWLLETIEDSQPAALLTDRKYSENLPESVRESYTTLIKDGENDNLTFESLEQSDDTGFEPFFGHYGDTVAILWTSGTTGKSKGVMQSHNTWLRAALNTASMGRLGEGDVTYNCLPLYNSAAWVTSVFPALISGTKLAIDPAFSASNFWDRTRYYDATHIFTLGAMHMFLWNAPPSEQDRDNPVRSANMIPMPPDIHRPFCQRFGIKAIHQGFGQSEVMGGMSRPDDGVTEYPPGALGHPDDDIEVILLDDQNQVVPVGEPGEICMREVKPHTLFNGYFNAPDTTEEAWSGGWYHSGDLARQDENGHYFFVDRKKDVIRYKGRNVSSLAIESVARCHQDLQDVAVYGVTSDELEAEHEIMLMAVPAPGASPSAGEIARYLNDNAPYFFVPRYIEFAESLPMTPTQKVRKVELRKRGVTASTWDARAEGFKVQR